MNFISFAMLFVYIKMPPAENSAGGLSLQNKKLRCLCHRDCQQGTKEGFIPSVLLLGFFGAEQVAKRNGRAEAHHRIGGESREALFLVNPQAGEQNAAVGIVGKLDAVFPCGKVIVQHDDAAVAFQKASVKGGAD